jgi:hypothetical protein
VFNEDRSKLLVADDYTIYAYGTARTVVWQSTGLGGIIVSISECVGGELHVEVEEEMGEPLVTVHLSLEDGSYLATTRADFVLFLKPWAAFSAESTFSKFFEDEVARELPANDSLRGRSLRCIAKNSTCDDVLFQVDDGTFVEVHLTFTQTPPERPGWPRRKIFGTIFDWMIESMIPEHEDHFGL